MSTVRDKVTEKGGGLSWDPRIVAFCCNWCSYAGADLAGVSRYTVPTSFRIIRIMCSGRMDPAQCTALLEEGMDGIMVLGCPPGDCHYFEGNYHAEIKMHWAKALLKDTQFGDERLLFDSVAASEGQRFVTVITDFIDRIRRLGPNTIKEPENQGVREELEAVTRTLQDFRLRALVGKVRTIRKNGNVFGATIKQSDLNDLVTNAMESEYLRNAILVLSSERDWSVPQLAERLSKPTRQIMRHVVRLRQRNLLELTRIEGEDPFYKAIGGV
jgi:F420-non-reducing hydrogenase iron-sulfur subunit